MHGLTVGDGGYVARAYTGNSPSNRYAVLKPDRSALNAAGTG